MGYIRKFAWKPRIVKTWRPSFSLAFVWLQYYLVKESQRLYSLNGNSEIGSEHINHIGRFSFELRRNTFISSLLLLIMNDPKC